eukprot:scaffold680_cov138-Isochrysis_galbana.AAC.3
MKEPCRSIRRQTGGCACERAHHHLDPPHHKSDQPRCRRAVQWCVPHLADRRDRKFDHLDGCLRALARRRALRDGITDINARGDGIHLADGEGLVSSAHWALPGLRLGLVGAATAGGASRCWHRSGAGFRHCHSR